MQPTKTLVHPSDREGCGFYRIVQPATAVANSRPKHFIVSYSYYMPDQLRANNIDRVVIQRHTEVNMKTFLEFYKVLNIHVVHDLDDLLWQVPSSNPYHNYFKGQHKETLKSCLQMSDTLVASTEELAEQTFKFVRKRPRLLPNYVGASHFSIPKRRTHQKLRVGWAGSNTHVGDLGLISSLVTNTLDKYDWVFMGYAKPEWMPKIEFHQFVDVNHYMDKLKSLNLDAVVIPLEDNLFNQCKSHVKLIEFGAIGVPAITTDISPYKENPNPKVKTKTRQGVWKDFYDALKSWENESVRYVAAIQAFELAKKYCLEHNVDTIQSAWGL